jgi:hypothetical protein
MTINLGKYGQSAANDHPLILILASLGELIENGSVRCVFKIVLSTVNYASSSDYQNASYMDPKLVLRSLPSTPTTFSQGEWMIRAWFLDRIQVKVSSRDVDIPSLTFECA